VGALVSLVRRTWNAPFGFAPAIAVGALLALLAPDPFAWLPGLR
jgi:prepilin signal peptidase PulO-like enzyme (type II secretory pathway)